MNPYTQAFFEQGTTHTALFEGPLKELMMFCDGVQEFMNNGIFCFVERSYLMDLGREYNVIVARKDYGERRMLLRLYLPAEGYPLHINYLLGADIVPIQNAQELENALKQFVRRGDVREIIAEIAQY